MKIFFMPALALLINLAASAQNRNTLFRLQVGPLYSSKTNLVNFSYGSNDYRGYSRHEKATAGISAQALGSFYIAKKWRLNTGFAFDTRGFDVKGVGVGAADGPVPYHYKLTGGYFGVPLSLEAMLTPKKKWALSVDAGLLEQWKISSSQQGGVLSKNQFSIHTGFYARFAAWSNKLLVHPMFRYGINTLQDPLVGGHSPDSHSYSFGLEIGYEF